MAFSKAHLYPDHLQEPAAYAKVLSHPERIQILGFLTQNGPTRVATLCRNSPLSESVISQHLKILRESGLILYVEEYPCVYYFTDPRQLKHAMASVISVARKLR